MVLVSIVGDFSSSVLPVFYEYADKIDLHIIVYDDAKQDRRLANNLIAGMKNFKPKLKTLSLSLDEDSLEAIEQIEKRIKNKSHGKKLYINSTDGLGNIATLFALKFLPEGANFIYYDRFDNTMNIVNKDGMQTQKLEKKICIQEHFMLKNITMIETNNKRFAKQEKNNIKALFEQHFFEYQSVLAACNDKTLDERELKQTIQQQAPNAFKILQKMGYVDEIKSYKKTLEGDMFEYYIYNRLSELDVDDIEVGVEVTTQIGEDIHLKNEFDILIMKNNHLHIIECKFKDFEDISQVKRKQNEMEKLIYKYTTLKHFVDDDGKNVLLFKKLSENKEHSNHYQRAKNNYMLVIDFQEDRFVEKIAAFLEI